MLIPNYEAFMLPVLRAAHEEPRARASLVGPVSDALDLNLDARSAKFPWNDQGVVDARIEHAARDLEIAGLVALEGDALRVTARGEALLGERPRVIDRALLSRFGEYAAHRDEVQRRRGA